MMAWFYPVFFVSGAAGLIYQVVWVRALADALGSTVISTTAVFSVFLAGLALGAWSFGRVNPWGRRALIRFVMLETAIAAVAITASLILFSHSNLIAEGAPAPEHMSASIGYALLVSVVLIAPPTILMGATLPTLLGAIAPLTQPRRAAVHLYGWNTVGAATGALAAGFVLIWALGLEGAVYTAAGLDLAAAVGALMLLGRIRAADWQLVTEERGARESIREDRAGQAYTGQSRAFGDWPVLAFVSGGLVLSLEILWSRIAHFLLGDRTQAIAALLFVFIAALGFAALLAAPLARSVGATTATKMRRLIGRLLVVGAAVQIAVLPPVVASLTLEPGPFLAMMRESIGGRLVLTTLLMAPPILLLGLIFPLLLWSADRMEVRPGHRVGVLYFVNTLGAVMGAILATYVLTRWVGTIPGFQAVSIFCGLTGFLLLLIGTDGKLRSPGFGLSASLAAVVLVAGVLLALTPASLALLRADETLVFEQEDEYGAQVLVETDAGHYRVRNNRLSLVYDLGHSQTTHAQQMAAHLTTLVAEDVENVLNIGTGYGITAGTYTLYPDVEYVRTVEILPFLVDLQEWLAPYNFGLAFNPEVDLVQGDGRQVLLASEKTWDIISVNVLDPYLPGSSGLYTLDFWREARDRLEPGGVYTQLFWGADVGLLVRGITQVFPEVHFFPVYGGTSFNVVAFRDEQHDAGLSPHFDRLGRAARREWIRIEGDHPEAAWPRLLDRAGRAEKRLMRLAREATGPLHTDDRPILEYRWSHGVDGVSPLDSPLIRY